jgi:hypothetical protein
MRRKFLVLSLSAALISGAGCFSRSTEAMKKTDGGGNMDRLKNLQGGTNPANKGKKGTTKADPGKSGRKAPKAGGAPDD